MDPTDIGLFRLAERRLAWAEQRQQLLAQNVANAATPGYVARDLKDFATSLARVEPGLLRTNALHLASSTSPPGTTQPRPHERTPDGNAVSVEEQLTRVADTAGAQELTTGLYRKYLGMFRTALGRTG